MDDTNEDIIDDTKGATDRDDISPAERHGFCVAAINEALVKYRCRLGADLRFDPVGTAFPISQGLVGATVTVTPE